METKQECAERASFLGHGSDVLIQGATGRAVKAPQSSELQSLRFFVMLAPVAAKNRFARLRIVPDNDFLQDAPNGSEAQFSSHLYGPTKSRALIQDQNPESRKQYPWSKHHTFIPEM
jgi:hypothetical protein